MIKTPQFVEIKWSTSNKKHYINKNYKFTKINDTILVNVLDLSKGSKIPIKCICDYCGIEFSRPWRLINLNRNIECNIDLKICCKNCQNKKNIEKLQFKYGVNSIMQLNHIQEKVKKTNISRYNCENVYQSDLIKNKIKQTNKIKYGFENVSKNDEIKNKIKNTFLKKYGGHPMQNKIRYNEARKKATITMYKNGTAPCSKQQKHIHNIVGGKLNYPVDRCSLDIAFPNEMIYIEYDGSGHGWYDKKYLKDGHKIVQKKDMKRTFYLKSKGWKIIRILCVNDKLPNDNLILNLLLISKKFLKNNNNSWVLIDFNKQTVSANGIHNMSFPAWISQKIAIDGRDPIPDNREEIQIIQEKIDNKYNLIEE